MFANYFAATDQEYFQSPVDWDFTIYGLQPKLFWFSKTELPLTSGCEIVRWDFRGPIRFRASLSRPKLQINFIDSYSSVASRLQGRGKIDSVLMITTHNSAWDGLTDVGALGIEFNFDERTTSKIITPETEDALKRIAGRNRSLVIPVTESAKKLKALANRYLRFIDHRPELRNISQVEMATELIKMDLTSSFSESIELRELMLIEMARNVIEEAALASFSAPQIGSHQRRQIALEIEKMLWTPPFLVDENFSATLNEFASIFKVTPRTIQTAIQEQFGLGFVAFRRLVRLTQLRKAIHTSGGSRSLSELAMEHRLHFGRLSKEYRELFGIQPSHELKSRRIG